MIMNKLKTLICVITAGLAASVASAVSINGSIAFDGSTDLDAPITSAGEFSSLTAVTVADSGGTGDYGSVPSGTPVTMTPFSFDPAPGLPIDPLWTFDYMGATYSFVLDAFSGYVVTPLGNGLYQLAVSGTGIASITGMDDTMGAFSLTTTGNLAQTNLGFGAFTFVESATVSDSGTTVALLGVAMLGFVIVRRRVFA